MEDIDKIKPDSISQSAEIKKNILKKRAEEIAYELEYESSEINAIDILEFILNEEIYSFEASYVKQVAKLKDISIIPCTPQHVLGVTAIYEQIISVIDIRVFFQMQTKGISNLNKIIILEKNNVSFAIAADEVIGIKRVPVNNIQKSIDTFDDIRKKFFFGLTDTQTIILDSEKIINDKEIIVK